LGRGEGIKSRETDREIEIFRIIEDESVDGWEG